jgi:antitoxin component YwqK of YwqJK toxin-antitoxin module
MNQILTGILFSFIFLSCGGQGNSKKENLQNTAVTPTVITKDTTFRFSKEQFRLNKMAAVDMDTSISNQYKDGKKEGFWKELDKFGRMVSAGYYKNGKANGWMKWYHEGKLVAEGNMIEGKRNGAWMICHIDDLSICIVANFEQESREGLWKTYAANGKLYKEQTWRKNQLFSEQCWDESGYSTTCE